MSIVLDTLRSSTRPVSPSRLQAACQLDHEDLYAELVRLEARGQARPILGYFPRVGHTPEAGWISVD